MPRHSHCTTGPRLMLALSHAAPLLLLVLAGRLAPPTSPTLAEGEGAVVGQVGGPAVAVAVAAGGDYGYLGLGPGVVVLDMADAGAPRQVGRLGPLPCAVTDVKVQDEVLYVAYRSGFATYWLDRPTAPRPAGRWSHADACEHGGAGSILPYGDYAYVTGINWGSGAKDRVFDVQDPGNPRLVGTFEHGPGHDMAVGDGHLYVAENAFVYSYDVADPAHPVETGRMELGARDGHAYSVAHEDGLLLVGTGAGLLLQGDGAADGARLDVGNVVWDVAAGAGLAWLAAGSGEGRGLVIVDTTDPGSPRLLASVPVGDARSVAVVGERAYVASGADGLWVVDASEPIAPVAGQVLTTWAPASFVRASGSTAFVASAASGLVSVDVSDPAAPRTLDTAAVLGAASSLALDGDHVYVLGERSGPPGTLNVFDASDPSMLRSTAVVQLHGAAVSVAAADGVAYVADSVGGLRAFDTGAPGGPIELGSLPGVVPARMAAADGHVFAVRAEGDLAIIDASQPERLGIVASLPLRTQALAVPACDGLHLYVAEAGPVLDQMHFGELAEDLVMVDVSDPLDPTRARLVDLTVGGAMAYPRDIVVGGGRAFVASGTMSWRFGAQGFGLFVANLDRRSSDPALWRIRMPDPARGVDVLGGHLVVAAGDAGLMVVDPRPPADDRAWLPLALSAPPARPTSSAASATRAQETVRER